MTVHPEPEADVLATLRDDITDLSNTETEPPQDSADATTNAEARPVDVTDTRETKQPSVDD